MDGKQSACRSLRWELNSLRKPKSCKWPREPWQRLMGCQAQSALSRAEPTQCCPALAVPLSPSQTPMEGRLLNPRDECSPGQQQLATASCSRCVCWGLQAKHSWLLLCQAQAAAATSEPGKGIRGLKIPSPESAVRPHWCGSHGRGWQSLLGVLLMVFRMSGVRFHRAFRMSALLSHVFLSTFLSAHCSSPLTSTL